MVNMHVSPSKSCWFLKNRKKNILFALGSREVQQVS
jgi:hypothetical protein